MFSFLHFHPKSTFSFDFLFWILLIASIGCTTLYAAAGCHWNPWAQKQLLHFGIGFVVFGVISRIDLRFWLAHAFFFYGVCFFLLIVVELLGIVGMGAKRWINLSVVHLQPSELMKIALILALAAYFHRLEEKRPQLYQLVLPTILVLVPCLLILKQPDLGTALILLFIGGTLFYLAGVHKWLFAAVGLAVAALCPLLWSHLKPYQQKRVLTFWDPTQDPLGSGYHVLQSKIAIGSGGLWGKGFGMGTQGNLNFLPEKQTDFVFTLLCEEWGFVGGVFVLMLYGILLFKCIYVALTTHYLFNRLLVLGVASVLFFHVFVNVGMVMGVLPVVGVPLPLLSYGGTSILTMMIGFGLVAAVQNQQKNRLTKIP